jgi:uncharacterized protein (TIGR02391 family)
MARKRGKKTKTVKQPAMRITRNRREVIEQLADALAVLAPATSRFKGFCVRNVAEEHGLKRCWKSGGNKRTMIARFLEEVFRQYPRKPKTVLMAIVRGGLDWRARRGEATTREELEAVAAPMEALDFDIRKDFKTLKLPEPSRVCAPAQDKVALLERLDLHEALTDDCLEMFRDGHFNEAVRKALERFEKRIQTAINDHSTIGKALMGKAFNRVQPPIPINDNKTGNDLSEQEGFMHLTMGAMAGLRNLYSHGDVDQMSATDAIERLGFVSLLFKRVDNALENGGGA